MKPKPVHYYGGVTFVDRQLGGTVEVPKGIPACGTSLAGNRKLGQYTYVIAEVTCSRCLGRMRKAGATAPGGR